MYHVLKGVSITENIPFCFAFLLEISCSCEHGWVDFSCKQDIYSKFVLTSTQKRYSNSISIIVMFTKIT